MEQILINCDLGENESDEQTQRLLGLVDAASICCGTHAGSLAKTRKTLNQAAAKGVMVGAHPGLSADRGRGDDLPDADHFRRILEEQLLTFIASADSIKVVVSYIKLHGSLYHAVERNEALADVYLQTLRELGSDFGVFALSGGEFQKKARAAGVLVREEIFAERGYRADGSLVPRTAEGALLDCNTALLRFKKWLRSGVLDTVDGTTIQLRADTVCVHSDSPGSETLLAGLRNLISP